MQRYLMNFDTRRMETRRTECLVIGSGVAGHDRGPEGVDGGLDLHIGNGKDRR